MGVKDLKDRLLESLNPSAFSLNSSQGIVFLLIVIILIYSFYKHAIKAVGWLCGILIVYEVFYCLSLTGLNSYIPLSTVFKHDVLVSIAQLFVGTPICDGLLYVAAFIGRLTSHIWSLCGWIVKGLWFLVVEIGDLLKDAWNACWQHEGR